MGCCLSERACQGHNLGPGSVLGAKGKKWGETVKIGQKVSWVVNWLGSARLGLLRSSLPDSPPPPPFPSATPSAYMLSFPPPSPAPLSLLGVYVVVQFYPWFKFYFLLFWRMVICDNEFETKEIEIEIKDKLNHNIYM